MAFCWVRSNSRCLFPSHVCNHEISSASQWKFSPIYLFCVRYAPVTVGIECSLLDIRPSWTLLTFSHTLQVLFFHKHTYSGASFFWGEFRESFPASAISFSPNFQHIYNIRTSSRLPKNPERHWKCLKYLKIYKAEPIQKFCQRRPFCCEKHEGIKKNSHFHQKPIKKFVVWEMRERNMWQCVCVSHLWPEQRQIDQPAEMN